MLMIVVVIVLGVGGMWVAWRLRIPSILVLLGAGILAGPVARILSVNLLGYSVSLDPNSVIPPRILMDFVGLAIGFILFEGGMTLRWREIAGVRRVVLMLVTIGAVTTWSLTAAAARLLLGLDWSIAILLGAVLIVTGPTVIGPLLHFVRPTGRVGGVLRWEGIVIDPIGAMAAVLAFEVIASGLFEKLHLSPGEILLSMAQGAMLTLLVGSVIGAVAALWFLYAVHKRSIPDQLQIPITLATVAVAFVLGNSLVHEAGLFATTTMGLVMANQNRVVVRHIAEFKETIATLLIGVLFILLASRFHLSDLSILHIGGLPFIIALIVVVRPLSVFISTAWSSLTFNDRMFLSCMAPRGIVAAGVASLFALRLENLGTPGSAELVTYTFTTVIITVLFYGLAATRIARWLGLTKAGQHGFLIVGADLFARTLARSIADLGIDVLLVDTNTPNVRDTRLMGLPVVLGSALSSDILEQIELSPIGHLLALTSNHEVNSMAAVQFRKLFGREHIYQLSDKRRSDIPSSVTKNDHSLTGRVLFSASADHGSIEKWLQSGATIRKTRLSTNFTLTDYLKKNMPRVLPLFAVKGGQIRLVTTDSGLTSEFSDQVVSLVFADGDNQTASNRIHCDGVPDSGVGR